MMKIILNKDNRYVGVQTIEFPLVEDFRLVEVTDEFGAQLNDLWWLDGDTWVKDQPPTPPETSEPVFTTQDGHTRT